MMNNRLTFNSGNERQGNKLKVTQDMVGDNQWTCIAINAIQGKNYRVAKEFNFKAGES